MPRVLQNMEDGEALGKTIRERIGAEAFTMVGEDVFNLLKDMIPSQVELTDEAVWNAFLLIRDLKCPRNE